MKSDRERWSERLKGRDRFDLIRVERMDLGDSAEPEWVEWVMVPLREHDRVSAALREVADAWDAELEVARRRLEALS
jgi:hypothetical protein